MTDNKKGRVFLSYAKEDLDTVRKVYDGLIKRGLDVWFDKVNLRLGVPWKLQIEKAIANSRYFIMCISDAAIKKLSEDKPGFQDSELHFAYNIAREQPVEVFSIIPVRLEKCDRGDFRLTGWQQLDLFDDFEKGLDKLAVDMGGVSMSDATAKDERSEDEKLIDSLFSKAAAEYYAGRYDKSIMVIESILVYSPDNDLAFLNKAKTLTMLKRYEEALTVLDKAMEIGSVHHHVAWSDRGIVLHKLGRLEESLIAFDKSLEIDPDFAQAMAGKGSALYSLGRYEEALVAFDKFLEVDYHDKASVFYFKGVILTNLDRYEEALVALEKSLEINPDNASALRLRNTVINKFKDDN